MRFNAINFAWIKQCRQFSDGNFQSLFLINPKKVIPEDELTCEFNISFFIVLVAGK